MKVRVAVVAWACAWLTAAAVSRGAEMGSAGAWIVNRKNDSEPMRTGKVFPKSPADKAGIKSGWFVISVDGTNVVKMPSQEVVHLIRGAPGTVLTLDLADPNRSKTNRFVVKRGKAILDEKGSVLKIVEQ